MPYITVWDNSFESNVLSEDSWVDIRKIEIGRCWAFGSWDYNIWAEGTWAEPAISSTKRVLAINSEDRTLAINSEDRTLAINED